MQTDSVIVDTILLLKKEKLSWYTCFIIANPHILQVKFEGQIVLNHKQNLHTHTTYADGKDTLEELVREAIKRDFGGIGFSEYSYMEFSDYPYQMTVEQMAQIGLAPAENWLTEEALEICDGFLIQGGAEFFPYHFQIIHHAVTRGKRYLGVCLGAQLIHAYFELKRRVEEQGYKN